MSMLDHFDEGYQIEPLQKLMLESLILPSPGDRQAYSRWLADYDFEVDDFATLRLLPALDRKFGDSMPGIPSRGKMLGIYRYCHYRNSLLVAAGRRIVERMLNCGIDVLLFKGIAVCLKYHRNIGIRPMGDMDVLVRRECVPQAERILRECGYRYFYPEEKKVTDVHSYDYINDNRSGFDLHWYSLFESPMPGIDDGIWERAGFLDWDGLVVKVMAPEDLIITSIVNGVRDCPIRPHWIHDIATIVDSEPVILWERVWEEAGNRDLRMQVFHGLNLVRSISEKVVPTAVLEVLLESDPEFRQRQPKTANAAGFSGQIRYFQGENLAIRKLCLNGRYLPLVAELFEVSDHRKLEELISEHPPEESGYLDIPPGVLAIKANPDLPVYSARLSLVEFSSSPVMAPGTIMDIAVNVENNSSCCWPVFSGSDKLFGVSYHLLAEDGTVLVWDTSRAYFTQAKWDHVTFVEPSQVLTRSLRFVAPAKPGRYRIQLDIVHELVTWFSQRGNQFPAIEVEVAFGSPDGCYAPRGREVVHETLGDETVIIDTDRGDYYTADGYGSVIWRALADGHDAARIIEAFVVIPDFSPGDKVVEEFINSLLAERLIVPSERGAGMPLNVLRVDGINGAQRPVLVRHGGASDLINMHPVRGTSAQTGWPHPPAESSGTDGPVSGS